MDIITLYSLLGVASGVLHPAQGCKILVLKIFPSNLNRERPFIERVVDSDLTNFVLNLEANGCNEYARTKSNGMGGMIN